MHVGLDRLSRIPALVARLRGGKVGLLAHPASVDRHFRHVDGVLADLGVVPEIYFGPEHGYGGEAQDMVGVGEARAPSGAKVVSLYGDDFASLSPKADDLAPLRTLVIDLADVGARYYTFVWTALLATRAAAKAGVHVVLLDRPNPIGTNIESVEGNLPEPRFRSFVGLEPIPVRHGMTPGEIVALFAKRDGLPLGEEGALSVVGLEGDGVDEGAWAWDRPFVMPSPNMPTWETALVYPGGCLIEGTNLSEGRGTTRPFEIVGAPFLDGRKLADFLARTSFPGFVARPITFRPTFHKHAGQLCGGVQIHVTDRTSFRPYATYLALVGFARRLADGAFRFRTERYEFVDDIPAFDLLTGGDDARRALETGGDPEEIARKIAVPLPRSTREIRQEAREALMAATLVP